ncbi:MAG: carboxypeptidase-like regulatory domain-containing protein, partial [Endomicrobia bacterium]|nr:carboxypeptidase-like regulatory domain-containing protein [Endomicrobiia bacterium]
ELSYDLTASKEGYLSDTVNIRSLDSDQTLNFKLQPDDGSGQTYAQPESSSGSDIQAALKENTAQADKETKAAEEKQRKVKEREEAAVRKAQEKEEAAAKKAQEKEAAAAAEREKEIAAAREKEAAAERKAQEEAAVKEKPRRVRGLRTVKKTDEEKQPAQTASAQQPSSSDSLITPSEKTPQVKKEKEVAAPQSKEKKIKIKGRVGTKTENMQGIELTLQPGGYKTSSDEKGRYSFDVPAPSGKYVLTPAAADFYFDPESADISGAASAVTQDFSPYVQLEGTVYAEKKPVGGASIQIGGVQTAVTDELGRFKTEKIEYGSPASVTVAKQGYIFYPVSFEYAKLDKNYQNLNFITAYSVSGKITAQGSGFGLSNVTVAVSGASETSVMADYGGNFVIPGLESGGTFTITPKAGGFSFTPASRDVANLNGNVIGQNFTAVKRTFTIKGNVNVAGKPIKNAIVSITKRALKYFTDDNGNFEMAGLDYGGPYTVSVESREHAFSPIVINVLSEDMEIEFSTDISLGGTVVSGGKPVAGVTVDVNGKKTKTDENGKFVMTGLRYEGDYLLSLSGPGMMFSPLKREYNQVRQSMLNEVFEASLLIGGTVSAADGRPVGGVEFTVSGDTAAYKSDDNGFYIIQNLKAGRDYTVTPASQDFTFSPPKRQYKNISAGSLSDNFKAVKKKFLTQDQ